MADQTSEPSAATLADIDLSDLLSRYQRDGGSGSQAFAMQCLGHTSVDDVPRLVANLRAARHAQQQAEARAKESDMFVGVWLHKIELADIEAALDLSLEEVWQRALAAAKRGREAT